MKLRISESLMNFMCDVGKTFTVREARQFRWAGYQFLAELRDAGLIQCDGVSGKNEKIWSFTEKGRQLSDIFRRAREVLTESEKGQSD